MKKLDNITIVCFSSTEPELAVKSIKYSTQKLSFYKKIVFSNKKPNNIFDDDNIDFQMIPDLNQHSYNFFILKKLIDYIETDFCLITHDDGFIINSHLWKDEFLNYDYIGAPWRAHYPHARVGNGGFSLRSKKFLKLCQDIQWTGSHEDADCCIFYKSFFENSGCKYAPIDIAMKFSLESKIPECTDYNLDTCFGFHGRGLVYDVFEDKGKQFQEKIQLLNNIK